MELHFKRLRLRHVQVHKHMDKQAHVHMYIDTCTGMHFSRAIQQENLGVYHRSDARCHCPPGTCRQTLSFSFSRALSLSLTLSQTHTHPHTHIRLHTQAHTCKQTHTNHDTRTHTHSLTYTRPHTHTHTHTHKLSHTTEIELQDI